MSKHAIGSPKLEKHNGIWVARDDAIPGGTKTRMFLATMFEREEEEFVYAGPAVGLAQVALAVAAYRACKQATIFVAGRVKRSARTEEALNYGAKLIEVRPGYLSTVQARAQSYCNERNAFMVPFGGGRTHTNTIVEAAMALEVDPVNVWCAAGSGTLASALLKAWPVATVNAVAVGRDVKPAGRLNLLRSDYAYQQQARSTPPFSADRYYEAKAWETMQQHGTPAGETLFWNVAGAV